jgi:hypothetical protein
MPTHATVIETADSFKLVPSFDPEAFPLFESDDADDVLAFCQAHGIIAHSVNA